MYVRQESIGAGLQECSLASTKQSETAKTFIIGEDPDEEQERHPRYGNAGRRNLGLWEVQKNLLDMRG